MAKRLTLALLIFALVPMLASCDSGGGKKKGSGYFSGGRLVVLPPGGDDLGTLDPQDAVFRESVIDLPTEVHGYPVGFASDGLLVASVEGTGGLNPFLELYDSAGRLVTGDDNGSVGRDSLLVGSVRAGEYTLLVWPSREDETTGGYRLNVVAGTPGGMDLEFLRPGEMVEPPVAFDIAGNGDVHTFVFTTSDDGFISFEVETSAGMANLGMRLRDQRGDEVFWEDPVGISDPIRSNVALPRGNYILTVENYEFGAAGEYRLRLTASP